MRQQGYDESDRAFALMKLLAEGIYDEKNITPERERRKAMRNCLDGAKSNNQ